MQKKLWPKVDRLIQQTLDLPAGERAGFLCQACAGDPSLLKATRIMLRSVEKVGDFMETPVLGNLDMSLEQANSPIMPDCIGNCQIVAQLGEGGMGVVYLARQSWPIKRRVALKISKNDFPSKKILARFSAEYQILTWLDHPFIARVFDLGIAETGAPYFTMEYVPGKRLIDYCRVNSLSLKEQLALFCRVCEGVQHAHQKGIIHCDLKPSNILVVDRGGLPHHPKLIDFGIARSLDRTLRDGRLLSGHFGGVGTPGYMSPEQAHRREAEIDTRTDVYALGAILYELLWGEPPWDRATTCRASSLGRPQSQCQKILPPTIRQRHRGLFKLNGGQNVSTGTGAIRGDLERIVMKALADDRCRRYRSVAEFGRAIERYLAGTHSVDTAVKGLDSWKRLIGQGTMPLTENEAGDVTRSDATVANTVFTGMDPLRFLGEQKAVQIEA